MGRTAPSRAGLTNLFECQLVPGTGDEDHVQILALDDPVEVGVEEVEPRGGAPVAEQPWLDVLAPQRLTQERVVEEVDLPDGEIVGRAPVGVDVREQLWGQWT